MPAWPTGRLGNALTAIHDAPARQWELADMVALAGMSRARFAARFREVTRATPADYLASLRILAAQRLLMQGLQPKHAAYDAGYGQPQRASVQAFLDAGFEEKDLLYILLAIAVKTLSNFCNHLFATQVDARFAAYKVD